MASDEEDFDDLEALRQAALASVKARPKTEVPQPEISPSGIKADEDEDLIALREAALRSSRIQIPVTRNGPAVMPNSLPTFQHHHHRRGRHQRNPRHHSRQRHPYNPAQRNGDWKKYHYSRNRGNDRILVPLTEPSPHIRRGVYDLPKSQESGSNLELSDNKGLLLPQHKWAGVQPSASDNGSSTADRNPKRRKDGKFSRYDDSESDEDSGSDSDMLSLSGDSQLNKDTGSDSEQSVSNQTDTRIVQRDETKDIVIQKAVSDNLELEATGDNLEIQDKLSPDSLLEDFDEPLLDIEENGVIDESLNATMNSDKQEVDEAFSIDLLPSESLDLDESEPLGKEVFEARKKKFESTGEIKGRDLKKTISLKGIVPKSRKRHREHRRHREKSSHSSHKEQQHSRDLKERDLDKVDDLRVKTSRNFDDAEDLHLETSRDLDDVGHLRLKRSRNFEDMEDLRLEPSQNFDNLENSRLKTSRNSDKLEDSRVKSSRNFDKVEDLRLKTSRNFDVGDVRLKKPRNIDDMGDLRLKTSRNCNKLDLRIKTSRKFDEVEDLNLEPSQNFDDVGGLRLKTSRNFDDVGDLRLKTSRNFDDVGDLRLKTSRNFDDVGDLRLKTSRNFDDVGDLRLKTSRTIDVGDLRLKTSRNCSKVTDLHVKTSRNSDDVDLRMKTSRSKNRHRHHNKYSSGSSKSSDDGYQGGSFSDGAGQPIRLKGTDLGTGNLFNQPMSQYRENHRRVVHERSPIRNSSRDTKYRLSDLSDSGEDNENNLLKKRSLSSVIRTSPKPKRHKSRKVLDSDKDSNLQKEHYSSSSKAKQSAQPRGWTALIESRSKNRLPNKKDSDNDRNSDPLELEEKIEKSPQINFTFEYDEDEEFPGTNKVDDRFSVHRRLGLSSKSKLEIPEKSTEEPKETKSEKKIKTSSGPSKETELDKKILRIQEMNAAILKRQAEVKKDKERYG